MSKSLIEFIRERRPEISAQIQTLEAELRQLDMAESALANTSTDPAPTIKEMALAVLTDAGHGLRSGDILTKIKRKYDVDVARESLSPQLTRLANPDKKIVLEGRKWRVL